MEHSGNHKRISSKSRLPTLRPSRREDKFYDRCDPPARRKGPPPAYTRKRVKCILQPPTRFEPERSRSFAPMGAPGGLTLSAENVLEDLGSRRDRQEEAKVGKDDQ